MTNFGARNYGISCHSVVASQYSLSILIIGSSAQQALQAVVQSISPSIHDIAVFLFTASTNESVQLVELYTGYQIRVLNRETEIAQSINDMGY
jgi:hypothetical protein